MRSTHTSTSGSVGWNTAIIFALARNIFWNLNLSHRITTFSYFKAKTTLTQITSFPQTVKRIHRSSNRFPCSRSRAKFGGSFTKHLEIMLTHWLHFYRLYFMMQCTNSIRTSVFFYRLLSITTRTPLSTYIEWSNKDDVFPRTCDGIFDAEITDAILMATRNIYRLQLVQLMWVPHTKDSWKISKWICCQRMVTELSIIYIL